MAILDGDAIHTAIRDRITGRLATPTVRAIPVGYFSCDLPEGATDITAAVRSLGAPVPGRGRGLVTVTTATGKADAAPSGPSSVTVRRLIVTLRSYYNLPNPAASEASYQKTRQQALSDADLIRQAFEWPGALAFTAAGAATAIVSGILAQSQDARVSREAPDGAGDVLVCEAEYSGMVRVAQDVS